MLGNGGKQIKETNDTITIEASVFTFGIIFGAAVQTNVVLWKICHFIKGHLEELRFVTTWSTKEGITQKSRRMCRFI